MLNNKIIITGATGFIGVNLINLLIQKNINLEIIAIDNLETSSLNDLKKILKKNNFKFKKNFFYKKKIKIYFFKKSYENLHKITNFDFSNINCLIHLAAQTGVIKSMKFPEKDAEVNIIKSIKLFQFLKKHNLKKIIFSSSMGVLGDNLYSPCTSRHNPLNFYAASKSSIENYLNIYNKTYNIKTFVLRFSNIYGKYSRHKTSVIATFFKSIIKKKKILVNGSGGQSRDFLFVEDLVKIIDKLVFSKKFDKYSEKPIHIASGKSITINQLIRLLKKELNLNFKVYLKPRLKGDIQKSFVKINEVKKLIKNFTSIKYGLNITYDWYKKYY